MSDTYIARVSYDEPALGYVMFPNGQPDKTRPLRDYVEFSNQRYSNFDKWTGAFTEFMLEAVDDSVNPVLTIRKDNNNG